MIVKLTWTPGSGATVQNIQYRQEGTTTWTTYSQNYTNSTTTATIEVPDGTYEFRIINDCPDCTCLDGSTPNESDLCVGTGTIPATLSSTPTPVSRMVYHVYGELGTLVHDDLNPIGSTTALSTMNPFWILQLPANFDNLTNEQKHNTLLNDSINGPVNRLSIWGVARDVNNNIINNYTRGPGESIPPVETWIGFDVCINIQTTKTYYVAIAGDNRYRLSLNNQVIVLDDRNTADTFSFLHIYPVTISAGINILKLEGYNNQFLAGFGCEVFDLDNRGEQSVVDFLNQQTNYDNLNVIFTTRGITSFTTDLYSCPTGYTRTQFSCNQVTCTQTSPVPCTPKINYSNQISLSYQCPAPTTGIATVIPIEPPPPPTEPPPPLVQCLDGLILEFMYFGNISDLSLLPAGYSIPCTDGMFNQNGIGRHTCNRAFFEVTANNVYVGDANMNNLTIYQNGFEIIGVKTRSGKFSCKDDNNRPHALRPDNVWNGTSTSRYARIDITPAQAQAIATATNSNKLSLRLVSAMTTYGYDCSRTGQGPHTDVTWFRVSRPNGQVVYNGCPTTFAATIDVCVQL